MCRPSITNTYFLLSSSPSTLTSRCGTPNGMDIQTGPDGEILGPGVEIVGPGGVILGPGGEILDPGGQILGPGGQIFCSVFTSFAGETL